MATVKIHRLKKSEQFRHVVKRGKRLSGRFVTVHFLFAEEDAVQDLTVGVVLRKTHGNAVIRNLYKRRILGIMREMTSYIAGTLVIRAKDNIATSEYSDIKQDIQALLNKLEVNT